MGEPRTPGPCPGGWKLGYLIGRSQALGISAMSQENRGGCGQGNGKRKEKWGGEQTEPPGAPA